jgi:histidine decarboxylase
MTAPPLRTTHADDAKLSAERAAAGLRIVTMSEFHGVPARVALGSEANAALDELHARCVESTRFSIGCPANLSFDYRALDRFTRFQLNNIGDPFQPSSQALQTHAFERQLIRQFAALTGAPPDELWGYVTSGGTEGNLCALALARRALPDAVVYASDASHYSVDKLLYLLGLPLCKVPSLQDGRMDTERLREELHAARRAGRAQAIVVLNVGTTMTGAIDDLPSIRAALRDVGIDEAYLHADAALSGLLLPFLDAPPPWCFADGVDSIAISGHKMIGTPSPCGVVLARRSLVQPFSRSGHYIRDLLDSTIAGSRSGLNALYLWYAVESLGREGLRDNAQAAVASARWLVSTLRAYGIEAWRNEHAIAVLFPAPPDWVRSKWSLQVSGGLAHVVTLPHVTRDKLAHFARELARAHDTY